MKIIRIRHRDSGAAAIAQVLPSGLLLVQFENRKHPHAYGWHLYPRHHFKRRKNVHLWGVNYDR